MKHFSSQRHVLLSTGMLILAFSGEAAAYIDPASGSFILQILIAGIVGASFAIKGFWGGVKNSIVGLFTRKRETPSEEPPTDSDSTVESQDDPE